MKKNATKCFKYTITKYYSATNPVTLFALTLFLVLSPTTGNADEFNNLPSTSVSTAWENPEIMIDTDKPADNKINTSASNELQADVFYPPEEELLRQGFNLDSYKRSLQETAPRNRLSSVANIWGTCPLTGTIHIPVLLVQFTDNMPTLTQAQINEAFNNANYLNGAGISVSRYWHKQSYGALNIVYDVYGWQTAPYTYAYYSQNDTNNHQLEMAALSLFNPTVDFTQYDNDYNGRLDGYMIIYPGDVGSAPTGIWPHARIYRNYNSNPVDGKYLGNVAVVPELGYGGDQFEIPITTHEFAHVLGLPDLYTNTPYGSGDGPLKEFTLMNFQFFPYCLNKPINLDVWSRYFFGWVNPIVLTTDSPKEISLRSINDYPDAVILKNANMTSREFFIIENRFRENVLTNLDKGMFNNATLLYGGFAIYHVDENKIEYDYPNNYVNWDIDNNWFDDTISHPGLLYEQNRLFSYWEIPNPSDLYFNGNVSGCDFAYFDENAHMCLTMVTDATTRAYSGVANPFIRFQALSPSQQPIMTAKMLVGLVTPIPQASPDPSWVYNEPVTVSLSDSLSAAVIHYTLDGTEPTLDSPVYSMPFTLYANTTLQAVAKVDSMYVSEIMVATYSINMGLAAPELNIAIIGDQATLTWNEISGADFYKIYASSLPDATADDWTLVGTSNTTSYRDGV